MSGSSHLVFKTNFKMKKFYSTTIIIIIVSLFFKAVALGASCDSVNNELNSKFRFLGEWSADGTPDYMDPASDEVSQALIDFVDNTLPESVNFASGNDDYFGLDVQLNTEIKEASEVFLTLVHEGAGWKNTLGYYTYDINDPPADVYDIDSLVILFPNVSQTEVIKPGDKVLLGEFPANTGIGYFLIAQGWVGDTICLKSHMIFTDSYLNTFTSEEYQQHTILLSNEQENKFLLGFEDIKRPGGDNDFNDAVFYITATPGAIDTTNIPKIPTAHLSGDTTLCDENAEATINIELTGQAPWAIVYNNGTENIEVSNLEEPIYSFKTSVKDTFSLVSVKDKNNHGIVSGHAIVNLSHPKAILNETEVICGGGEDASGFIIELEGIAPFSLTFSIDNEEKVFTDILENHIEVSGITGQVVELISMSDQFCDGEIIGGAATIQSYSLPTLLVEGNGSICGDALDAVFNLNLEGEGPWTLNYSLNDEENELTIENANFQLDINELGSLTFNSLADEHCEAMIASIYNIETNDLPTVEIQEYTNLCGDDEALVSLALTGEGPWSVQYKFNEEVKFADSDVEFFDIALSQSGSFELLGVSDANCENLAEGQVEINIKEKPQATISGDSVLCEATEVPIYMDILGVAPFTIVYTDGITETSITTSEEKYKFMASDFGTFTLVSIEDNYCTGEVSGSATLSDGSEDINVEIEALSNSCFGEEIQLNLIGDTDNLTVEWTTDGSGSFDNSQLLSATYTPSDGEVGVVEFFAEVTNGCGVKTVSKEVTIIEDIDASFDVSPSKDLLAETQITFTPHNNNYDEYNWNFGDDNSSQATIASNEYLEGGVYAVELLVSLHGCEGSDSKEIEVLAKDELYVPNAFNPNAINPENQVVKVYGSNIDDFGFSFKIVNRWGKVMYKTDSFDEANNVGWGGVNNNTNEELELNVFTYILKGQFIEGESFEKTGTITQVK